MNAPEPKGEEVDIHMFVDSDHAGEKVCGPCPYDRVHPLALLYAYKCSNQCEHMYFESGLGKHVNRKIYIIESRIKKSSERGQKQLKKWKKGKRYHVSEMPFD